MTKQAANLIKKMIIKKCQEFSLVDLCKSWGVTVEQFYEFLDKATEETVSRESYDHEYFLRKEFELKIDKLQRQLEEQAVKAESILDKIRTEITAIVISGQVDEHTSFIRTGEQVKQMAFDIIDKYREGKE